MSSSSRTGVVKDAAILRSAVLRNISPTNTTNELPTPLADSHRQCGDKVDTASQVPPRKRMRVFEQGDAVLRSPKRTQPDRDTGSGLYGYRNSQTPPASGVSATSSASSAEFPNLVEEALNHPAFPAVLLNLFSAASNRDVSRALPTETLRTIQEADGELAKLAGLATSCGVEAAVRTAGFRSLDIFFAILAAAITNINSNSNNGDTLGGVVSACQHAFSMPTLWGGLAVPRAKLDSRSRQVLDHWFNTNWQKPYPDEDTKAALAKECRLTVSQVATYFSNRRMRWKRKLLKTAPNMDDGVIGTNAPALSKWRVAVIAGSTDNTVRLSNNGGNNRTHTLVPIAPAVHPYSHPSPQGILPQYGYNQYYDHEQHQHHQYQQDFHTQQHSLDPLGEGLVNPSRPPLRVGQEGSDGGFGSRCSTPPRPYLR